MAGKLEDGEGMGSVQEMRGSEGDERGGFAEGAGRST